MKNEIVLREIEKVIDDYIEKLDSIVETAKRNGTWQIGLDTNRDFFEELEKDRDEKIRYLLSMADQE